MSLDPLPRGLTIHRMVSVTKPPSNIVPCRNAHFVYLCERMREDEREQYMALTGAKEYDPEVAARGFMNVPGIKFSLVDDDGYVCCAGGWEEVQPGIWQSWMVGTMGAWEKHWRTITKGSRWVMDGLFEMGARRLQTNALASRTAAIEWYERGLGMKREGTWRKYGANGEDIACFSRVKED